MVLAIMIIIVLGILLLDNNDKIKRQKKKIQDLEARLKVLESGVNQPDSLNELTKYENSSISTEESIKSSETVENISDGKDINITEKIKKEEQKSVNVESNNKKEIKISTIDRKNNNILLTGSILIVLAAIVFLTSTWHTIPDVLKTLGLILFIVIFLGASKIAKDKFKLEKTSKTFFYIAMAYIPISLIGISFFGLLGNYLSIRGEGRGIYLALVSTFLAILYYVLSKANHSKGLFISSVIAQCSAVVAFASIVETKFNLICAILLLYNTVLILLSKDNLLKILSKIILYVVSIIFVIYVLVLDIFTTYTLIDISVVLLVSLNYFIMNIKYKSKLDFALFNIFLIYLGTLIITYEDFNISNNFMEFLKLLWILTIYFFLNVLTEDKKKLSINLWVSMIAILLCSSYYDEDGLKFYIYAILESIILTVAYIRNVCKKESMQTLLPIAYLITGVTIILEYNLGNFALVALPILSWGISLFIKDNKFKYNVFIISHIALIMALLNMIISYNGELLGILLLAVIIGVYIISYYKRKRLFIYKYGAYLTLILTIWSINLFIGLELDYYILPVSSIIIIGLEYMLRNKAIDEYSEYFIMGVFAVSYLSLIVDVQIYNVILSIVLSVILFVVDYFDKKNSKYNMIGLGGSFLVIALFNNIYIDLSLGVTLSILSLIGISKKYDFTLVSLLFILAFGINYDNTLVLYFILLFWAVLHLFAKKDNKNIFKIFTYIFGYLTYREILTNLELDIYVSSKILGVEIFAMLLFNTCFNKENKDLDIIKSISYGIVYIWAIFSYNSIVDGMVSVGIMIAIVILSYLVKDGTIVLINLVAIIINAFALTREFWLSIPWWIYLLVVGFILIGFAIINEAREKDDKIKIDSVIKSIKDKIEK